MNEFVQEHRWNEHGERTGFTIPGTQTWIDQAYDAMGNLTSITRGGTPLMTATYRGAGRPQTRTVFTGGSPIVRTYTYDDATSLLSGMAVTAGANVVAGADVAYDGLQKSSIRPAGVSAPVTTFTYDSRSRLVTADRSTQILTPADFRTEEQRARQLDDATRAALQARGMDTTAIDPPSSTFSEQTGHKIASATRGPVVRPFGYNGAERADDGRFTYEFDVKGRLIRATEKSGPGRYVYQYSATGRLVGRGDTTFVWDPISDRLIAVVAADGTVQKQIIHGDAAYDDPLEVTTPSGRLFPVFDEAGAGTMQAVLNDHAEVIARNVPNDPYGAENVAFTGAAIDRVAIKATKKQDGTLDTVEVTIHSTEALAAATVTTGARLATIDNKSAIVRSASVAPTLADDPFTLHWTLTPSEWQTLIDPTPVGTPPATRTPIALSIAATATLRAAAWSSSTPILPPPDWVLATRPIHTSTALPVEIRESLPSLTTFLATVPAGAEKTSTLYAVDSLPLLGTPASDTLFEDVVSARFQALPFQDPDTGLIYARNRWYDPSTGTFLTPDPLGYVDSANLYSFAGGDPVNGRDPTGEHTRRTIDVNGMPVTVDAPTLEEMNEGDFSIGVSYTPTGRANTVHHLFDSSQGADLFLLARVNAPGARAAFEQFYGVSIDNVDYSGLKAWWQSLKANAPNIALSTLGTIAAAAPAETAATRSTTPRVNMMRPRPQAPIEEVPGAVQSGQRVYKIPPGSTGGDTAYQPITAADRARFFEKGDPLCSYCRSNDARPVDHVRAKSRAGNREPENLTPACDHCNPSKGARVAPKTPPRGYVGEWPPSWWPEWMRDWWKTTYGGQ